MIEVLNQAGSHRVVFAADGVVLFESNSRTAALQRAAVLSRLADRRGARATSEELLVLFPPTAPGPLAMLSAEGGEALSVSALEELKARLDVLEHELRMRESLEIRIRKLEGALALNESIAAHERKAAAERGTPPPTDFAACDPGTQSLAVSALAERRIVEAGGEPESNAERIATYERARRDLVEGTVKVREVLK